MTVSVFILLMLVMESLTVLMAVMKMIVGVIITIL